MSSLRIWHNCSVGKWSMVIRAVPHPFTVHYLPFISFIFFQSRPAGIHFCGLAPAVNRVLVYPAYGTNAFAVVVTKHVIRDSQQQLFSYQFVNVDDFPVKNREIQILFRKLDGLLRLVIFRRHILELEAGIDWNLDRLQTTIAFDLHSSVKPATDAYP